MSKVGQRNPVYCTSLGKTLLAFQPEERQLRIMKAIEFKPLTPNTLTSKKKLIQELQAVRKQGYALDRREIEEDVECISAPIRDYQGSAVAAVSISGPQRKIGTPQEKGFVSAVVQAAAQISAKLGFQPPAGEQAGKKSRDQKRS